jgi:hypothetical protein
MEEFSVGDIPESRDNQNIFIYATETVSELEDLKNKLLNKDWDEEKQKWVVNPKKKPYCNEAFINAVLIANKGYANKVCQQSNFPPHIIKATIKSIMRRIAKAICFYYDRYEIDKIDRIFVFDACYGMVEGVLYRTEGDKERGRWIKSLQLKEMLRSFDTSQHEERADILK